MIFRALCLENMSVQLAFQSNIRLRYTTLNYKLISIRFKVFISCFNENTNLMVIPNPAISRQVCSKIEILEQEKRAIAWAVARRCKNLPATRTLMCRRLRPV